MISDIITDSATEGKNFRRLLTTKPKWLQYHLID